MLPGFCAASTCRLGRSDANRVDAPLAGVPHLKLAAVADDAGGLILFALNRDLTSEMRLV
jgi:hypothetical protein